MVKRFAVIGLGYFGERLALELTARGAEVIVIDNTMSKIEDIKDRVAYAIRLDSTDESALRNQGLEELDAVIVTMGEDFESTLLTCVLCLQFKCKKVIARSTSPIHTRILRNVGVHTVLSPEEVVAERLSYTLLSSLVLDIIPLTDEHVILQVEAPSFTIQHSLMELDLRKKYNVNLITIKRQTRVMKKGREEVEDHIIGVPLPETLIQEGDILVLMGTEKDIQRLIEE